MSIHICDHCGKPVPDDAAFCTHCGAKITEDIRLTKIPETIEELKAFCAAHKMPLDAMRFFIGENFKGAKAFGIYKDGNGNCVVYKNKADGSRAIRYEGPDEKYAVRELYEKLKSETDFRRRGSDTDTPPRGVDEVSDEPMKLWEILLGGVLYFWKPIVIALAVMLIFYWIGKMPDRGYYRYQGDTYYYQDSGWYFYNTVLDEWEQTYDVPEALEKGYDDYFESKDYNFGYGTTDFSDSDYYREDSYSSGSSYDDYDWDSSDYSSWDSFDTDWDSDW